MTTIVWQEFKYLETEDIQIAEDSHNSELDFQIGRVNEEEVAKRSQSDRSKSSNHAWKFQNFKFPSTLPDSSEQNVMFFNISKKKQEPKKVSAEDIYRIFGKKANSCSQNENERETLEKANMSLIDDKEGLCKRIYRSNITPKNRTAFQSQRLSHSLYKPPSPFNNTMNNL